MNNKSQVIRTNLKFELVKKNNLTVAGEFSIYNDKMVMKIARECGGNGLAVYMCLYSHLNKSNGICNPSIKTIATETGLSEKSIKNIIKKLKEEGFIDWAQIKTNTNAFNNNHYAFLFGTVLAKEVVVEDIVEPNGEKELKSNKKSLTPDLSKFKKTSNKEIGPKPSKNNTTEDKLQKILSTLNRKYGKTQNTGALKNIRVSVNNAIKDKSKIEMYLKWMAQDIEMLTSNEYTLDIEEIKLINKEK